MGIIIRQSLKASIVSYVGVGIGALNNLYIFPKYLGSEGIGLMNVIYSAAALFLPFLLLGFPTSLVKFFPMFKDKPNLGAFLTYSLILPGIAFGVFVLGWPFAEGLFQFVFEENAGLIFNNILWVMPLLGILVFLNMFEAYARVNLRIVVPTLAKNVIWKVLLTISALLIAYGYFSNEDLVPLYVLSWGIIFIIICVYSIWLGKLRFKNVKGVIGDPNLKKFNSFSGYVILLASGGILITKLDQLMVASYLGTSAAGVFTLAMHFAVLIEIPKRSIEGIIQPVLAKSFKEDNMEEVDSLYKKSSLNLFLIGGGLFVIIWASIHEVFQIIPRADEFSTGVQVVFFYGLARVIDMGAGCNMEILIYSKYYRVNIVFQFIFVGLVILSNWYFIPRHGIVGAAIATCVSIAVYNTIRFLYLYWRLKLQPFKVQTLWTLIILTGFYFLGEYLSFSVNPIYSIILKSAVLGIPMALLFYFLKVSDILNDAIDGVLAKVGLKKGTKD